MAQSSWGMVATVDEPAPLVAAMVLHHIDQGAREVHLYLDRPIEGLARLIAHRPEVRTTLCDEAYWAASPQGRRPASSTIRQLANADRAYRTCGVDWLLHIDADEFVDDGNTLAWELERVPPEIDMLRLPNAERAFLRGKPQEWLFEGVLRRPHPDRPGLARELYRDRAPLLLEGVLGYFSGKALTRTGRGLFVKWHVSRVGHIDGPFATFVWAEETRVLHFNAITRFAHRLKMQRRNADLPHRRPGSVPTREMEVYAAFARCGHDPEATTALIDQLLAVGPHQRRRLEEEGLLVTKRVRPGAALRRAHPDIDLTPAAYDAALLARSGLPPEPKGTD